MRRAILITFLVAGCASHVRPSDAGYDGGADAAADAAEPESVCPSPSCLTQCCDDEDGTPLYCCGQNGYYPGRGYGCGSAPPCPANNVCLGDAALEPCGRRCFPIGEEPGPGELGYADCLRELGGGSGP